MAITYDERKGQLALDDELVADLSLLDDQMYLVPLWIAAPDLLAACQEAHALLFHYGLSRRLNGVDWGPPEMLSAEVLDRLWQAIVKAIPELKIDLTTLDGLHAHMDALARQDHPEVADIEWTRCGPWCLDCARLMRPWGRGWACGCGRSIDQEGNER